MDLVDLTHSIMPEMPVYPGTESPRFEKGSTIQETGFLEKKITLFSHTGTHMDAPAHMINNGATLDQFPIDHFYGSAFLFNFSDHPHRMIEVADLQPFRKILGEVRFLIIHSGWSRYWGRKEYFSEYPVLTSEAAKWISRFQLYGLGTDTISVDRDDSVDFPVHRVLFDQNMVMIENLTNLEKINRSQFFFSCFPMHIHEADGAPVRAVAFLE